MFKTTHLEGLDNQEGELFPVLADMDEGGGEAFFSVEIEETLPILPLRNMVLFPGVIMPVTVGREINEIGKKSL